MNNNVSRPNISIIIISKNKEKYIGSTLDMVLRQNIGKEYEVIIIDSGSQDYTLDIVRKYPVKIVKIPPEEFGHGRTRNKGARIAKGEIIVFLNADATPRDENWLKSLIDNFKNNERVAAVYSSIYPRIDCNPLRSWEILEEAASNSRRKIKYIENFDSYINMSSRDKRNFLSFYTISCAIKKDILIKYLFKDIEFGEDLEWGKRIIEMGFKIIFEPKSRILHSHDFYYSFTKTFKRYFDDAQLNNNLLNIWPWYSFPKMVGYMIYKVYKDIKYIIGLNKDFFDKVGWLVYSPIIRLAELCGIILGANSEYLPARLQMLFSLVKEIKKTGISS